MSTYRPIGYCTICRRPVYGLTDLNSPCSAWRFGRICHGEIASALDLNAWVACSCQSVALQGQQHDCRQCNGSGWVLYEKEKPVPSHTEQP